MARKRGLNATAASEARLSKHDAPVRQSADASDVGGASSAPWGRARPSPARSFQKADRTRPRSSRDAVTNTKQRRPAVYSAFMRSSATVVLPAVIRSARGVRVCVTSETIALT